MIITISGKPGSGKSSIAKMIAEKYKLKYYSTGEFFRTRAKEKNLSLKEFSTLAQKEREHDNETDKWQIELGKKEDNFVIEGRLGHKFIEKAVKIYLDVDKETGAERIMNEKRDGEIALDKSHAIHLWEHRIHSCILSRKYFIYCHYLIIIKVLLYLECLCLSILLQI